MANGDGHGGKRRGNGDMPPPVPRTHMPAVSNIIDDMVDTRMSSASSINANDFYNMRD